MQGTIVYLTKKFGDNELSVPAFVLSATNEASLVGPTGAPALTVAFLHPQRKNLLGSADWRNGFDRAVNVKHVTHGHIDEGKESQYWQSDYEFNSPPIVPPAEGAETAPVQPVSAESSTEATGSGTTAAGNSAEETTSGTPSAEQQTETSAATTA